MYDRLRTIGTALAKREGDVLSISDSTKLCEVMALTARSLVDAHYPEYNLLSLQFPDESFDFVVSDQVLEHIEGDPQQGVNECWRVLRPGGICILTTCFINPIRDAPGDYWRFTPAALRLLAKKFTRVIECDGWGNFDAWWLIRMGLRWDGIPHAKWHPLHRIATKNDPLWPIVTWLVAEK